MQTLTTGEQAAVVGGAIGATLVMVGLMALVLCVIYIVAWWKIFKKAGLAGWKSIIPIYNAYCLFRISGMSGWWILVPLLSSVLMTGAGITYSVDVNGAIVVDAIAINPAGWIGLILSLVAVVIQIVQVVKIAGNFHKGTIFKICSVFFSPITYLILAFGKAKYDKKALHD